MGRAARRAALVLAAAFVLVLVAAPLAAQAQQIKIAVVDLELVVANSPSGKALQQKLEKFQQDIQGEAEAMSEKARDIRKRMTEGANSLTEDKLAELNKQYEDQMITIRRFRDDKQREGQKMQAEGLREIEKQLKPVFEKIRDEGGYDLILNNVPGVVVMANDKVDITQDVVSRMNTTG
jgi:Skp family chaperone for outer membrane proteins